MRQYWILVVALGSGLAVAAITKQGSTKQGSSVETQKAVAKIDITTGQRASSAPYRDGLYLGKLAAERGDSIHVATGRWARGEDRALFLSGYDEAFRQVAERNQGDDVDPDTAALAAFRDGLYLGKLASGRGDEPHVAVGRWSLPEHRVAFAEGYSEGFKQGDEARTAQNKLRVAQLIR
jgi:hypothetical protein